MAGAVGPCWPLERLTLTWSEMESHWKTLRREATLSDLHFRRLVLAAGLRLDGQKQGVQLGGYCNNPGKR